MVRVAVIMTMDRNGLLARIVSKICDRQSVLIAYLGVCLVFSLLSVYSLVVLDGSAPAYVLAQVNLAVLTVFEGVLVGLLYVCNQP
jgi:hypothetical protein